MLSPKAWRRKRWGKRERKKEKNRGEPIREASLVDIYKLVKIEDRRERETVRQ